jgi:hypothetical protein
VVVGVKDNLDRRLKDLNPFGGECQEHRDRHVDLNGEVAPERTENLRTQ